jgi:hypothetical protein
MKRKEGHKKGLTLYFRKKNASKALDYDSVVALTVRIISSVCLSNLCIYPVFALTALCQMQIKFQNTNFLSFFLYLPSNPIGQ